MTWYFRISIHSLRVEGDVKTVYDIMTDAISIHSLRVEGDIIAALVCIQVRLRFQSTPSVWRETGNPQFASEDHRFQSTPSVWRETVRPHDEEG